MDEAFLSQKFSVQKVQTHMHVSQIYYHALPMNGRSQEENLFIAELKIALKYQELRTDHQISYFHEFAQHADRRPQGENFILVDSNLSVGLPIFLF